MDNLFTTIEKELIAKGIQVELCEGEYLFHQNDIPESIYFILKGEVLCVAIDGSKKLISCNKIYGLREMLLGEPYGFSAIALSDVKLMLMDKENILSILTKNRKTIFKYIFSQSNIEFIYE